MALLIIYIMVAMLFRILIGSAIAPEPEDFLPLLLISLLWPVALMGAAFYLIIMLCYLIIGERL